MSMCPVHVQKALSDCAGDLTPEGPITRLEILHCQDGDPAGELIERIYCREDTPWDVDLFHQAVWDKAEADAKSRMDGVTQRYKILFFRGSHDNTDYERSFPFVIRTKGTEITRAGDNSTPPNEIGITAQSLRHDAEMHRMMMLMSGTHAERSEGIIDRLQREIDKRASREERVTLMMEDLLDRKAERDIRVAKETQRAKRFDEIVGMVTSVLPIMFAELRGGGMTGIALRSKLRDQAIGNLLKQLTPEQLIEIVNKLPIEAQIPFFELYKSYKQEADTENAQKPEPFKDKPPPDPGSTH